jgi:hypothetical protein
MSHEYRENRNCRCARCIANGSMGAAVLITLGTLFLLSKFYYLGFGRSWPVLLIVIGVMLFLQRNAPVSGHVPPGEPAQAQLPGGGQVNHD